MCNWFVKYFTILGSVGFVMLVFASLIALSGNKTGIREVTENNISIDIMAHTKHGKYRLIRVYEDHKVHVLVETPSGMLKIDEHVTSAAGF